jgi:proteic killer suppression protein
VIRTFRHRGLKKLYSENDDSRVLQQYSGRIRRILTVLDAATAIDGIALPGFRLHPLKGDRKGSWSVTVSGNWRIVFRFEGGDVFDVDLVDYH